MRKYFAVLSAFCIFSFGIKTAGAQGILNRAKNSANNKVNQRVDEKVDKAIDKTLDSVDNPDNKSKDQDNKEATATNSKEENTKPQSAPKSKDSVPAFAVYQNYDFI